MSDKKTEELVQRIDRLLAKLADLGHVDEVAAVRVVLDEEFPCSQ